MNQMSMGRRIAREIKEADANNQLKKYYNIILITWTKYCKLFLFYILRIVDKQYIYIHY